MTTTKANCLKFYFALAVMFGGESRMIASVSLKLSFLLNFAFIVCVSVCVCSYLLTTVELLGAFWVFRLVEITWGNLMERRRSREHELRQPGSPLVIGPKPPS